MRAAAPGGDAPVATMMAWDFVNGDLIWQDRKPLQLQRRYARSASTRYVYLSAPESFLSGVIDFAAPVVDTATRLAELVEQARSSNGTAAYACRPGRSYGSATPSNARRYRPVSLAKSRRRVPAFRPRRAISCATGVRR